ncbi:MAG: ABC transporter ATP-binding protein [Comamonadaceae bacterium]|nr:ABC transporter ATP-binding protein [Comamonadaceae bacterium]
MQFLAAAGMVLVLWMLGGASQARSPAEMVSFLLYAALLTRPVSSLADVYGQTRRTRGALERLGAVLTEPPESAAAGDSLPPVRGEIEFQGICLRTRTVRRRSVASACISGPERRSP